MSSNCNLWLTFSCHIEADANSCRQFVSYGKLGFPHVWAQSSMSFAAVNNELNSMTPKAKSSFNSGKPACLKPSSCWGWEAFGTACWHPQREMELL
eukprot:2121288-Amphidinium_carterae.1